MRYFNCYICHTHTSHSQDAHRQPYFVSSVLSAPPSQTEESGEDGSPQLSDKSKHFNIHDIADLQDNSFTVRIQPPGTESFELQVVSFSETLYLHVFLNPNNLSLLLCQVSGQLFVAELHQVLMEHEITCHRTCFSLQLGGTTLDGLSKLCSIQGIHDGSLIQVVEGNCLIFFFLF